MVKTAVCNLLSEKAKASISARDADECTPLHLAVMFGRTDCVSLLLLRDSSINLVTRDGSTVLHLACRYRRPQILDSLLSFIERNIKHFNLITKKDKRGFTCIHWAALQGDIDCLKHFPEFLDIPDNVGFSPLHWAALNGHRHCVHYLLSKQVTLNHVDYSVNGKQEHVSH